MDTLYLVFKHRFQIVIWICVTEAKTSPQANEDFNPGTQPCQADYQPLLKFFSQRTKRLLSQGLSVAESWPCELHSLAYLLVNITNSQYLAVIRNVAHFHGTLEMRLGPAAFTNAVSLAEKTESRI